MIFFFENDISRLINIKYPINNINDLITNRFYWIWTTILAKIVPFSVHNINSIIMLSDFQESCDHRQQFQWPKSIKYVGLEIQDCCQIHFSKQKGLEVVIETIEYHKFFCNQKFVFPRVLWPYIGVSVGAIGNNWWVCDHTWLSYALEQPEWLRRRARTTKDVHHFAWTRLYQGRGGWKSYFH